MKYLSFYTVKIAQISHRYSLFTNVYDIQFHKNLFFLFPKLFEYVPIERRKCNNFDYSF